MLPISDAFMEEAITSAEVELNPSEQEALIAHLDQMIPGTSEQARAAIRDMCIKSFLAGRVYQFVQTPTRTFPVEMDADMIQEFVQFLLEKR